MQQLRHLQVNPGGRVIGRGGSRLGTVQQPIHNAETGNLTAFTLSCGWFGRTLKLIPAEYIKQVNPGSDTVVVRLDKKDLRGMFNAHSTSGDPAVEVSLPHPESKVFEDGD
jgi:hypothetical protein